MCCSLTFFQVFGIDGSYLISKSFFSWSKSWRSCFAQSVLVILHFSTIIERSTRKTPPLALSVSYLWRFLVILASKNLPHVHFHVSQETTSEKATCPSFWDFIHVCLSSRSISFRVHWSTIISFMCFWFCWWSRLAFSFFKGKRYILAEC